MTERTDLTTFWEEDPRIIEAASPSVEIALQDLHDTLRSNTKQAGEGDLENIDDDFIIDSAGKEDLGGGVSVGITSTLQQAEVAFESRLTPAEEGTITTADGLGTSLIDSTALFVTNLVKRGAIVINFTDESITEVLKVISETELFTRVLRTGVDNDYDFADVYKVWNVIQCEISGGNLVSVDDVGDPISAVFPTAFTQIVRTSASSATLQELQDIEFSSFEGRVTVDVLSPNAGTAFPTGTLRQPVNNFTDMLAIANTRGLNTAFVLGNATIPTGLDFAGFIFLGQSFSLTTLTVAVGATVPGCEYFKATVAGTLGADSILTFCEIDVLTLTADCKINNTGMKAGPITLVGSGAIRLINCFDDVAGAGIPMIDFDGTACSLIVRDFRGGLELINKTSAEDVSIDLVGRVILDSSVTAGSIIARGIGQLLDSSVGASVSNEMVNIDLIWDELIVSHGIAGTFGEIISLKLLTFGRWLALRGGPGK